MYKGLKLEIEMLCKFFGILHSCQVLFKISDSRAVSERKRKHDSYKVDGEPVLHHSHHVYIVPQDKEK